MYCGSCQRDNNLARQLIRMGHDVTLVPLYTPTLTDEENVSEDRIFFGGISIYLQQKSALFRNTPRFLDRIWDSSKVIKAATSGSIQTSPENLGALTVSTLQGAEGNLRKEFDKFLEWAVSQPRPDVVALPYTLLIALAKPLREALGCPILCALQGEDLFLEGLQEPWRTQSLHLIRDQIQFVDLFLPISEFYERLMSAYLGIPRDRMEVLPLGIAFDGYQPKEKFIDSPFKIGYFSRIAPEKGLHVLAEAMRLVKAESPRVVMKAAGYMASEHRSYLKECHKFSEFEYLGVMDREQKQRFLESQDVICVPGPYADPKGTYALEALAAGTPFVQARHGVFTEIAEKTGGGFLAESTDPRDIAAALLTLARNRERVRSLATAGTEGVRREYSLQRSAERALEIYSRAANRQRVGVVG
jgi:glycosyltransferase involved in cell wall biosynthesis